MEIHGIPEKAYETTEEVVLKLANALDVPVNPQGIEIPHKLKRKGTKPIIVRFVSHKVKTKLYKARTKLKNVSVSELFPASTAATRIASGKIYLFENLASYRKKIVNRANEMRNDGLILSVWTMDGKIFRSTLNFRKFKVALNPMYRRMLLNFFKSCVLSCLSNVDNIKKFHRAVFEL